VANLADKVHIDEVFLEWYFYDEASNLRDSDMGSRLTAPDNTHILSQVAFRE
jgi:hypothetical protein